MYGPLVVLLENFDRADALSWSLLSRCAEEIDMPVMVIVAVRPNDGIFATPPLEQVGDTVRCWHQCFCFAARNGMLIGAQHLYERKCSRLQSSGL